MNFFICTNVKNVFENLYLVKNETTWILTHFFQNEDYIWEIYFYKTLNLHSWGETVFSLTSLENYKQFLYLISNTKKVPLKILAEFSEQSYIEKINILNWTSKIKWLAKAWLDQLQWKILLTDESLSEQEYIQFKEYLLNVSKDRKWIDKFLLENWQILKWKEQWEIVSLFLSK